MTVWRWIETGPAGGAFHMAVDQALLENVGKIEKPVIRVYSWKPACISLGANQNAECIDLASCRHHGIEVVRRPTGGRAVLHDREVTYSAVFPEGTDTFLHSLSEIYDLINRALLKGLRGMGITAELEKRSLDIRNHYQSSLSASCFSASAKYEIIARGGKLVGSAQRRLASGVLQHGSILLGRGHFSLADFLANMEPKNKEAMHRLLQDKSTTLEDALNRPVRFREVAAAVKRGITETLHIKFEKSELTREEKERSEELVETFSILSISAE